MMQRKGIPRSYSNASYFHLGGGKDKKTVLPVVTNQDRKTTSPSRPLLNLRRRMSNATAAGPAGTTMVVDEGCIGSISVATVGRVLGLLAIFFVSVVIVKTIIGSNAITEELELDSSSSGVGGSGGGSESGGGGLRNNYWQTLDEQKLPLSEYPSIQYALDHSDIVLLYFAASWCQMSTPITQLLDEKFGDILLPPEDPPKNNLLKTPGGGTSVTGMNRRQRRPISLVYVSSDKTEEEMIQYTRKNWIDVPFHSEERANLKKHFKVAAKREIDELGGIDRMYELPTIIIVSGESHSVVTTHGVSDLKEKGSEALIHWIKLLHTVTALEDKYY